MQIAKALEKTSRLAVIAGFAVATYGGVAAAQEEKVLNVYNWSDYIAEDTIAKFEEETGITVNYDVYDGNEVLEAKLLAGNSGFDIVVPTLTPFAARHIESGLYQTLDKATLSNYGNLDPTLMERVATRDPGNAHVVPYMWGTTGIGINVDMVRERLGADADLDSWDLLFDPETVAKLSDCGVSLLDTPEEVVPAMLNYLGHDPNSTSEEDLDDATEALLKVRPYVTKFHSSQYINDLANGDVCIAHGYSGDILQARDRAAEAGNGVEVAYIIPKEGALMWTDVLAVPSDAPHPDNAHAFIDFILRPEITAAITNYVAYANANKAATPLVDEEVRDDPGIYPPQAVMERLYLADVLPLRYERKRTRAWTRIKTGN